MQTSPDVEPAKIPPVPPIFAAVVRPVREFLRLEAASGILLVVSAVAALAWANLGGGESYRALVETPIAVSRAGDPVVSFTLRALVNDGLMTLFFFLVGMEIKHELVLGELRTPARATLPAIGAVGGMIVPAGVYLVFNRGGEGAAGWGVPMATDIAFAVGVLTMLRSRVPHGLVVFVTALAIFDDIGGILVIAFVYGHGVSLPWVGAAAAVTVALVPLALWHVRNGWIWGVAGALLWFAFHHSGVHATIAGVVLGLAVPARPRAAPREVFDALARHASALARTPPDEGLDLENLRGIEHTLELREAPLGRFTGLLHPWVAFGVVPVFAFVNSGVEIAGVSPERLTGGVAVGTAVALFAGKLLGIFGLAAGAIRLGLAPMPAGATYGKLFGVSVVAGIGFTVALFIAGLAFSGRPALLDEAKLGILAGSLAAGVVGALALRATAPVRA